MTAELRVIREDRLTDIPTMLRRLADLIEAGGEHATSEVVVVRAPTEPGPPAIYAYGQASPASSLALLARAQHALCHIFDNGPVGR